MDLALAMLGAPREQNYSQRSVDSLRAAGFRQPLHFFAEPTTVPPAVDQLILHANPTRLGCYGNWRNALTWLVGNTSAAWVMLLQDDTIWRNDGAERLAAGMSQLPDAGMLSPYCSVAMAGRPRRFRRMEAWHDAIFFNKAFWGALAICMPRASAERLLACDRFQSHKHHRKLDVLVGNCFRHELQLRVLVYAPSLVDHIGAISTLGRHKVLGIAWGRRGLNFRERA